MPSDDVAFVAGCVIGGLLAFVVFMVFLSVSDASWEADAIKHGAAQYHPETGQFEWKVKVEDGSK